ncbi:unnamed protein product [Amoebophrya sp. A120]|nr:unnamed protein product [Amoebophrya sp. A120]|eukprot:GSA120T00012543001.1
MSDDEAEVKKRAAKPSSDDDESSSDDLGPMPAPEKPGKEEKKKKRKIMKNEKLYQENLPKSQMYEKSFMHREPVRVICTSTDCDFVVTGSEKDGIVKFWKKQHQGIEFVKLYRAHALSLLHMTLSASDGRNLATVGVDCQFDAKGKPIASSRTCALKYFDVANFDLSQMIKLDFVPLVCCFVSRKEKADVRIAVTDQNSGAIRIFSQSQSQVSQKPILEFTQRHQHPISILEYHPALDMCLSHDKKGFLELWDPETGNWPSSGTSQQTGEKRLDRFDMNKPVKFNRQLLKFKSKTDGTDLYELNKKQTSAVSLKFSPNGEYFAMLCLDERVRIFRTRTGKKFLELDEAVDQLTIAQNDPAQRILHLDHFDFGKRVAVERELKKSPCYQWQSLSFDESSNYLLYPTLCGVKIFNLTLRKLENLLGKVESTERFLQCALFQGKGQKRMVGASEALAGNAPGQQLETDPTLFATSFRKNRFFLFTKRDPEDDLGEDEVGRDVFNELPSKEEQALAVSAADTVRLGREAIISTSFGDIVISLFFNECPKTVENFCTHAKNGYYNNLRFHRVIKGFMIQTGDPQGDGTGGESIWGGHFADEIRSNLRHDRPFTVSMANAGPNTNGSQFFITTVNCPHLDRLHTVFGRVVKGEEVVSRIERVATRVDDRPVQDVQMMSIQVTG